MEHYLKLKDWLYSQEVKLYTIKQGKFSNNYWDLKCGFDIETTTYIDRAYMYIWQIGINNKAFYGNTWEEFNDCLNIINCYIDYLNRQKAKEKHKKEFKAQAICFIHNIAFEWQFVRKEIPVTYVFLKSLREPLYFESDNIKFLDSFQITNMSLAKLAKRYCTTQKMVGDIDYTILRNATDGKNLTDKEKKYCENDVLILCEFAEYYFNKYISNNELIYTETSIVRHSLKKAFKEQNQITKQDIFEMYPKSFNEYLMYMEYLFAGGWVKSSVDAFGKILSNIKCKDITSSYPAQIAHRYYPTSKFKSIKIDSKQMFNNMLNRFCCILDVTLFNVKKTTIHSIISTSKIVNNDAGRILVDNGRIAEVEKVRLLMTELDWDIFNKFYEYDKFKIVINSFKIAVRGKLPSYVVSTMLDAYERKEELKLQDKDYFNEKCFVNMFYGCFVTKIHKFNYIFKDGSITKELNDYYKQIRSSVLSPFWGIWCTSWARFQELSAVYANADCVVYGDTDSVKGHNMPDDYFNNYNAEQIEKNKKLCEKYNKNFELIKELGCWDTEPTYQLFKTIGCKRYIGFDENNKLSVTIAGVPKGTLEKIVGINPDKDKKYYTNSQKALEVMDLLKDGQSFSNCKTGVTYNDNEHSDIINGELMVSKSSVAINNIDFTIKVSNEYNEYINQVIDMYERDI
nr:MAG TPA: DNA polymerase B [Caudoviricetes sp.]